MEQHVVEAALAVVSSRTDASTRAAASQYLNQWTRSAEAWISYPRLVHFSLQQAPDPDAIGVLLLTLQLLQAKIRREVPRGTELNETLSTIQATLGALVQRYEQVPETALGPLCICLAALSVRTKNLERIVESCCHAGITPAVSLRLLSVVPLEVEACSELSPSQTASELWPYAMKALGTIGLYLISDNATCISLAVEGLKNWICACRISLTVLSGPPSSGGTESLLQLLIGLLSRSSIASSQKLIVLAAQALTEAAMVPTDSCTESRTAACAGLFNAIPSGFVTAPLQYASEQGWDDASHALSTLICTLVTEEIDTLVEMPAESLLHLLLQIQNHPLIKVRIPVFECWLTVQDTPTSQRNECWRQPLFRRVMEGIVMGIQYPEDFVDWASELEVDASDFEENRRMVVDVLISTYTLLRSEFVERMSAQIVNGSSWVRKEAALFALTSVTKDVCGRVKSQRAGLTSIAEDRSRTSHCLLNLVQQLVGSDPAQSVAVVLEENHILSNGIADFIGAYAKAWAAKCPAEAVVQLLCYLHTMMVLSMQNPVPAARAIRSLLVGCADSLKSHQPLQPILYPRLQQIAEGAFSTENEEVIVAVTEGYTRLAVQLAEPTQSLSNLIKCILLRGEAALGVISSDSTTLSDTAIHAVDCLGRVLRSIQILIQFCDASGTGETPLADILSSIWPLLERVSDRVARFEYVLDKVLAIHEQLLRNAPEMVAPHFESTVKYVMAVFEKTKHASTLGYFASAVEAFGASNHGAFQDLLSHVSSVIFSMLHHKKAEESSELIRAYFELNQRYVLYCPLGLTRCHHFNDIVSSAVECLTIFHGERESTRSTLNFLVKIFGWRLLRLDPQMTSYLQVSANALDEQLARHGARTLKLCMETFIGGPQMLWPVCTDCVYSITCATLSWPSSDDPSTCVAQSWLLAALPSEEVGTSNSTGGSLYHDVVRLFLSLAQQGQKSKAKAKMLLTDYCKIQKGELGMDALLTYRL